VNSLAGGRRLALAGGRRLALAALAVIVLVPITVVVALHRTPAPRNPPRATTRTSPPAVPADTTPFLSTTSSPAATLPIDTSVGLTLHDADTLLGQLVQRGVEPYSDPKYWHECLPVRFSHRRCRAP
jgi:hypothetical protein